MDPAVYRSPAFYQADMEVTVFQRRLLQMVGSVLDPAAGSPKGPELAGVAR